MCKKRWMIAALLNVGLIPSLAQGEMQERPIRARDWTQQAKVLTARSCVGEAGFDALDECIAIAWVYATRARETKMGYVEVVKRYSAALKSHSAHRRPWINELNLRGDKPDSWPQLRWGVHRHLWKRMLSRLDDWAKGTVPNPLPDANHYGSEGDAKRARYVRRWKKLDAPPEFKNWFFDSTAKKTAKVNSEWNLHRSVGPRLRREYGIEYLRQ